MTTYTLHRAKLAYSLLPMEQKEIALILGVTQQRVSQLLYRARLLARLEEKRSHGNLNQRRETVA